MSYTSVISEAWKLLKDSKKLLVLELIIVGGFYVITNLITSYSPNILNQYTEDLGSILIMIGSCVSFIITIIVTVFDTGIYKAIGEKLLNKKDSDFSEVFGYGFKNFLKILVASFLGSIPLFLIFVFIFVVASILGIGSLAAYNDNSTSALAGVGAIVICCGVLILVPILIGYGMFLTTIRNAILVDNMGTIDSISYSFNFTKKYFGKLLILTIIEFLLIIVALIPIYCFGFSGGLLLSLMNVGSGVSTARTIDTPAYQLFTLFLQIVSSLYSLALTVYLYCFGIVGYLKIKKLGEEAVPVETAKE